ncbi:MAG: molybdopterin-guanine dinucleotide biosynthesis protein B [Acidobacteriota bacterium]|nr:molybdopterin-guanine dinucleotide biosynthesis protein B [Acidobacteriota bacterium]MDQ7088361.1 molybdopterin-guanine dinucleotide biosynthesis protein B [Acidobacteriota bacterium]
MTSGSSPQPPWNAPPAGPVLAICGWSGSGKTTLLEATIPRLRRRGLAVALVKHDSHKFRVDHPGKDSDRLFRAGADVLLGSPEELFARTHGERRRPLPVLLADLLLDHDLVLVEGHKSTPLPKVWLEGSGAPRPGGLEQVLATLAWDSDRPAQLIELLDDFLPRAWNRPPLYGGILVGGRSRRMGQDKAGLEYRGERFVDRVAAALAPHVEQTFLLGAGRSGAGHFPSLPDPPGIEGPLAGLLAAVRWAPGAAWLIAACDLPLVHSEAAGWLLHQRRPGTWGVLPRLDPAVPEKVEPLFALYEPQTAGLLAALAATGPLAPRRLATHPKIAAPTPPEPLRDAWRNVNTPGDLDALPR